MTPAASPTRRPRRLRWFLALAASCAALVVLELAFRALEGPLDIDRSRIERWRDVAEHGGVPLFTPKPYYNYVMTRGAGEVNSLGFFGDEWKLERTPGVLRIACLGGSTTASGNTLGYQGSYPCFLARRLKALTGREVEVMNCGVPAWTSAEMMCAWFLLIQDYRPDLVILHEVVNDTEPRMFGGFRADYAHWRAAWRAQSLSPWLRWLIERSDAFAWAMGGAHEPSIQDAAVNPELESAVRDLRLPADTIAPYRRNIATIGRSAVAKGAAVLLATLPIRPPHDPGPGEAVYRSGIAEHNAVLRELAAANGWMLVDFEAFAQAEPESIDPHFLDLVHMDPLGNFGKAEWIAQCLLREWAPLEHADVKVVPR